MAKKKSKPDMLVGTVTLSKMFGVTPRTVQRLAQEGVLPKPEGKEGNANLYRLDKSVQAYINHLKSLAEQRADKADQNEVLKEQKIIAETELKKSQLELHRLKIDINRGKYLNKTDAVNEFRAFYKIFKKFALCIPGRVTAIIKGYVEPVVSNGIEKDLRQEVNSMLKNFIVAGHKGEPDK